MRIRSYTYAASGAWILPAVLLAKPYTPSAPAKKIREVLDKA